MIRVLHLTGTSAVGDGVFSFLLTLYRHMDRGRFAFDCLTFSQNKSAGESEWEALGGRVVRLPTQSIRSLKQVMDQMTLAFSDRSTYAVAHCHVPALSGLFLRAAKQSGVPMRVLHSHSTAWTGGHWHKALRNAICTRFSLPNANARLACSEEAGVFLFGKQGFHILPPAVETERLVFQADIRWKMRQAMGLHGKFVVGHVGRFAPEKNQLFLIKVFSQLHRVAPQSVLVLVGDGPCRLELENACARAGLENAVRFSGVQQNVSDWLQAMDAFVFPSRFEGFGTALLEARISGLPCVVSDTLPRAACALPGVCALSLRDTPQYWAKTILSLRGHRRLLLKPDLQGYSASEAVEVLERFYVNGLEKMRIRQGGNSEWCILP